MNKLDILGFIGGFLLGISFLPQAWQTIKTKNVADLSLSSCLLNFVTQSIFSVYHWDVSRYAAFFSIVAAFTAGVIVILKLRYSNKSNNN